MSLIKNQILNDFLNELKKEYVLLDARNEILPFKKYFFPPVEEMFFKEKNKIKIPPPPNKIALFGLNEKDLNALSYLDEIMRGHDLPKEERREPYLLNQGEPFYDYFYFKRRDNSIVIGLISENSDLNPAADIIFQKFGKDFHKAYFNTKKGENIILNYDKFFEEKEYFTEKETSENNNSENNNPENLKNDWEKSMESLLLDPEFLKDIVKWSYGHKIWEELAETCLGCGICSYVCPICFCFSTEDSVSLSGKCERCRKWNACTLPSFSQISGGHNFRPNLKDRYYNWFYHKFARGYLEYGKSQCVGCGRCKKNCPAKIDILEILKKIIKEYKETKTLN